MKLLNNKLLWCVFISLITATFATSCDKDDDENKDVTITTELLCAKWNIDAATDYLSVEFTQDGDYIIALASKSIVVGAYSINGNKIALANYGTIEVVSLSDNAFSFKLDKTGSSTASALVNAVKDVSSISNSERSSLLCKTWKMETITCVLDELYDEVAFESIQETVGSYLLFSKAGTYLAIPPLGSSDSYVYGQWKWEDSNENAFVVSWNNWEEQLAPMKLVAISQTELTLTNDVYLFSLKSTK